MEPAWLPTGPVPWVAFEATIAVTFNCAGVTFTLRGAAYVNFVAVCEDVRFDEVADIQCSAIIESELSEHLLHSNVALCEVALKGFVYVFACDLAKTDLHGFVTVVFDCLFLNDDTRTSFNYCYGNEFAILVKKLCHTQLSAYDAFLHGIYLLLVIGWQRLLSTLPLQTSIFSLRKVPRGPWIFRPPNFQRKTFD